MTIIRIILAVALIGGLFVAGWRVHRRLPNDGPFAQTHANDPGANSELTIVLRSEAAVSPRDTKVELYPIDFAAAQRDFLANAPPGKSLEDYLAQRMKGLAPIRAQLDTNGRALATLSEGNWWIHATTALTSGEILEWQVPIVVTGRGQTIELSADNAYQRTKKF